MLRRRLSMVGDVSTYMRPKWDVSTTSHTGWDCSTYLVTIVILGKRSKPFFQLSHQWSIMQNLNILSEKSFFSAVFIYGYCFWGFLWLLINCCNNKTSNFSFTAAYFFSLQLPWPSSLRLTVQIQVVKILLFTLKISFLLLISQPIISAYAHKFSKKGVASTRFAKYLG